jgi:hypothetical protein
VRVPTPVDTYVEPVVTASPRNGVHGSQLLRLCTGGSPPLCQYSMLCGHYPGGRISFCVWVFICQYLRRGRMVWFHYANACVGHGFMPVGSVI